MNVIDLMTDERLLGRWFRGDSWKPWKVFLCVVFGLHDLIDDEGMRIYRAATARENLPSVPIRQAWPDVGRRGGKSLICALVAVYLAFFRDYTPYLAPGEVATIMIVAADRRQARVVLKYVRAFIEAVPFFAKLLLRVSKESIEFANRVVIEVHTASYRSTRGYTLACCINDEVAFWMSDDSAEPDREILQSQLPAMATIPGALSAVRCCTNSRAFRLNAYKAHWGKDSAVLYWKAPSRALPGQGYTVEMNSTIDLEVVRADYESDPAAAASSWGAEFRCDLESLISRAAIEAATFRGRLELPLMPGVLYGAFCDPSGGSADAMTLAVAHMEGPKAVLDCLRERKPPFSPDDVTKEFAATLKRYRILRVTGDRYSGAWCAERFRMHGITVRALRDDEKRVVFGTSAVN